MNRELLILVDERDGQLGLGEKMAVHREGRLHRCFSIFVFNALGEALLQKRAVLKYHSGGLWTNACCGHPTNGEDTVNAAHRRLREEMGFDCDLEEVLSFTYRASLDNGLIEHEFDHVFTGRYDGAVLPNPREADDYKWIPVKELMQAIQQNPEQYTVWSRIAFELLTYGSPVTPLPPGCTWAR